MKHDVFGLYVAVDYSQRVDLVDRLTDLPHDERDPRLRQRLGFFELVVELPPCPHLQNNVYIGRVVETAVHLDDIGVVEEHLDLDLSRELVGDLLLPQQTLLYDLQRTDEIRVSLTHEVHPAVLAVSQLFDLHEIVNGHPAGSCPRGLTADTHHQLPAVGLESGLYDETPLQVVVGPAQEGGSRTGQFLSFLPYNPQPLFLIFEEIDLFVGMHSVLFSVSLGEVRGEVFDGLAHARRPPLWHVLEEFLLGRGRLLGSLVLLEITDDQTLRHLAPLAPGTRLRGNSTETYTICLTSEVEIFTYERAIVGGMLGQGLTGRTGMRNFQGKIGIAGIVLDGV